MHWDWSTFFYGITVGVWVGAATTYLAFWQESRRGK